MRTRKSERAGFPAAARDGRLFRSLAACFLLYMMIMTMAYAETKSVTVTFGSHAYQTFKTTLAGENHGLNINKAAAAPNIARSLISAQDTQDAVLWKPARITTVASTHTYTMTGTKLNEPLWVEIEGEFVKTAGGTGVAGVPRPDFQVTVIRVEIEEPDGLPVQSVSTGDSRFRLNPSCFEWQFVHVDNQRVAYHTTQPIVGLVEPIPPASYNWSVSEGTINNPTSETPTYVPNGTPVPSTMTTVDLELRHLSGNNDYLQTRTLEVYRDHLERDYQNWGTGIDCGAQTAYVYYWSYSRYGQAWILLHSWNCFGSVWHAFDGTHDGYATDLPSAGFTVTTYDDPVPWSTAVANLQRGDIVSFYRYDPDGGTETLQHAQTCMGSSSQMYGANNQPIYGGYIRSDGYGHSAPYWEGGSWRWWMTSSETYYNQLNAGYHSMNPWDERQFINRIKVHRR